MRKEIVKVERSPTDYEVNEANKFSNSKIIEIYEEVKKSNWNIFKTDNNYFLAIPSIEGQKNGCKSCVWGGDSHFTSLFIIINSKEINNNNPEILK